MGGTVSAENGRTLSEAMLTDAIHRAENGVPAILGFLSPGERRIAERYLRSQGVTRALFWGGYPTAERTLLLLPPEYLEESVPRLGENDEDFFPDEMLHPVLEDALAAIRIRGSGYRTLTHRDYLGSLLALGIERDVLGDIAVQNEREAVVFCTERMVTYLLTALEKVANDSVRCERYVPDEHFTDGRRYAPMSDTVASMRLDCIVASLANLSREAAQRAIHSGMVEVNYEVCERVDRILEAPTTLSVRGVGKFILRSTDGETRKGRIRIRSDKLI